MCYVFDLDGTLVDTRQAVVEAYRAIGVEMPEDAWGKPYREWLPQPKWQLHEQKAVVYPTTLARFGKKLGLYDFVKAKGYPVLTGASYSATLTIQREWGVLNIVGYGMRLEQKAYQLNKNFPHCTYVDDLESARAFIKEYTTCHVISPQECLDLFLRQEPTPGFNQSFPRV